jgi:hypothetical protein
LSLPIKYLDSSIIVSYALGPTDRFYTHAKQIIENDILKKQTIGLVSMLTLLECIDVIRYRIAERTSKAFLDSMDENARTPYIKTECDRKIKNLINVLTQMENQGHVMFADFTPLDLKQIMTDVYDYSKAYFVMITKYLRCKICRNLFEHYTYKGLGWIDLLHAFLALELFADGVITADKSFGDILSDPRFARLQITII